jgi:hypothetical protein
MEPVLDAQRAGLGPPVRVDMQPAAHSARSPSAPPAPRAQSRTAAGQGPHSSLASMIETESTLAKAEVATDRSKSAHSMPGSAADTNKFPRGGAMLPLHVLSATSTEDAATRASVDLTLPPQGVWDTNPDGLPSTPQRARFVERQARVSLSMSSPH